MRAAIYNPYLDTLGGGERYTLSFAKVLTEQGFQVDVEWRKGSIKGKLEERFGIDLSGLNFIRDIKRGDGYDVCFWVSDGSIPTLRARKNYLHFQIPFHGVHGRTLINKMKLFRINKIICNSNFTKNFIDREYGVDSLVIYPPVDTEKLKSGRKTNSIFFVGRFSQLTQAKNQEFLIRAFKVLYDKGNPSWELILAGGSEVGAKEYLKHLKSLTEGYPIKIIESPSYKELVSLYAECKIFWSAVGFGVDEEKEPEKVEHFGITLVEAMAAGAIPIVYSAGGYKEIITNGENGFFWNKKGELIKKTIELMGDKALSHRLSKNAIISSKKYSFEGFRSNVEKIL